MMKKLMVITLVCLLTLPAFADEQVNRMLDAASDGHVDVSNIAGSVTVNGWNRNTVEVTGTLGRNVEELIFERDGDTIEIKVKVPRRGGRGIESDLRISVPKNSSLDIGTVSADIDVSDVAGEQSLSSVSGDIETDYTGEDLSAQSVSGDVEVSGNGVAGDVVASTVSGDVTLFRVSGKVEAESVSGGVVVDEGSFERAELGTVNGDIVFQGKLEKGGRLSIDTVNGGVDVEFDGDVSARFEIDTFNGGIHNCFGPKAERTSKYAPGWELEFTEGSGSGRVEISTMNGGVTLCKK
ncbi:MAG: DUF4097 domain-containing protein [Gammaproteobacteria bacterium]|nr:DUF4097 domain-containing protein [Gammaproteobacteria bacterium]MDH5241582.1 DUF4097 domain-containing protein [Gammaproteobacteria bacterium]MDH5262545.1 DUF4097 domain-containing protein [Gammaproteobacteria bacterium]MDH5582572.1 DUF4097 domain-containing protein [Gammaproteobacteria bacterium]